MLWQLNEKNKLTNNILFLYSPIRLLYDLKDDLTNTICNLDIIYAPPDHKANCRYTNLLCLRYITFIYNTIPFRKPTIVVFSLYYAY